MAIQRPRFYEGQVLGATDLTAGQDYHRDQMARHQRYAHSWGIVSGLELVPIDAKEGLFDFLEVQPGLAIDSSGREVVVPEAQRLSTADIPKANRGAASGKWIPIFLSGRDETPSSDAPAGGPCSVAEPNRISEAFVLTFGRPGEEDDWEEAQSGLGQDTGAISPSARRVLIGFILPHAPNAAASGFANIWPAPSDYKPPTLPGQPLQKYPETPLRFAGVHAARIESPDASLTLSVAGAEDNQAVTLRLQRLSETTSELQVGTINAERDFVPQLRVDAGGNLKTDGTITAAQIVGAQVAPELVGKEGLLSLHSGPKDEVGRTSILVKSRKEQTPGRVSLGVREVGAGDQILVKEILNVHLEDAGARVELAAGNTLTLNVGDAKLSLAANTMEARFGNDASKHTTITQEGTRTPAVFGANSGGLHLQLDAAGLHLKTQNQADVLHFSAAGHLEMAGRLPGTAFIASGEYDDGAQVEFPKVPAYALDHVQTIVHLSPLVPDAPGENWLFYSVTECAVGDNNILSCKVRWFDPNPAQGAQNVLNDQPGKALCTVIMHVPHTP